MKIFRRTIQLFLVLSLTCLSGGIASAAIITWDNGGGDGLWSNCTNWSGNTCPGSGDIATFDGSSNTNSTIDASFAGNILGLDVNSGYTSTITHNSGSNLLIGTSDLAISSGTVTMQSGSIMNIEDDVIIDGGTFNAGGVIYLKDDWTHTLGGTFNHSNGTIEFDESSDSLIDVATSTSFYNFRLNKTGIWSLTVAGGDTITVVNNTSLLSGRLTQGSSSSLLNAQGHVNVYSNLSTNSLSLQFSGTNAQNFDLTGATANFDGNVTVNKASGTVTLISDMTLNAANQDFTLTSGTFDPNGFPVMVADRLTQSGGTYSLDTGILNVDGIFILSGGTFNAPSTFFYLRDDLTHTSGGTYNHNNGTLYFDGGTDSTVDLNATGTFYNVTVDKDGSFQVIVGGTDIMVVTGDLHHLDGRITGANTASRIYAQSNVLIHPDIETTTVHLEFTGTGNQNFDLTGATDKWDGNINVDKASGTLTLLSDLNMDQSAVDFALESGNFDPNDFSVYVADQFTVSGGTYMNGNGALNVYDVNLSGGTLNAPSASTLTFRDDWTHTVGGTFSHNNGEVVATTEFSGLLELNASVASSGIFYDFTLNKPNNWTVAVGAGDVFVVQGDLIIQDGYFSGANNLSRIDLEGDLQVGAGMDNTTIDLLIDGTGAQDLDFTGAEAAWNGNITVNKIAGTARLLSDLTQDASDKDLILTSGTFDLNGFDVTVNGVRSELTVGAGVTLQMEGAETITANASFPTFASGWTAYYDGSAGPYTLKNYPYHHLTINGAGARFIPAANVDLNGNLALYGGILSLNDLDLTVDGTFVNQATLEIEGTETLTFTQDTDSGAISIVGDSDGSADTFTLPNFTFYDLQVSLADATDLVQAAGATLNVNNNLSLSGGTFTAPSTLNVGGGFSKTLGTFAHNNGTVNFVDATKTGLIVGNHTWNNLRSVTAGKRINFTAGSTQTVGGTLTVTGEDGNPVLLRSSVDGSQWDLIASNSSVDYVDVKDSDASAGNSILHAVDASRSLDSGNNLNWGFNDVPEASAGAASQSEGGSTVTLSVGVDDPDDDEQVSLKVDYSLDGGVTWNDATIVSASTPSGSLGVNNATTYQVGTMDAYINVASGPKMVTLLWNAGVDAPGLEISTARLRVTPYDQVIAGATSSSASFTIDTKAPSAPSSLQAQLSSNFADLTWNSASDINFDEYFLIYGPSEVNVNAKSGTRLDSNTYTVLANSSTRSLGLSGLSGNYIKLFAIDTFGNESSSNAFYLSTSSIVIGSGGGAGSGGGGGSGGSSHYSPPYDSDDEEDEETPEEEPNLIEDLGVDLPDHWSQGYVKNLSSEIRLVDVSTNNAEFLDLIVDVVATPDKGMTRGEALYFLVVLSSYDTSGASYRTGTFSDVQSGDLYADEIQFAYDYGLIHGYPDGSFQSQRVLNRAEALKMSFEFFQVTPDQSLVTTTPFVDVEVGSWYYKYLVHAVSAGVIEGYKSDMTFRPAQQVSYAELLKIATLVKHLENAVDLASELEME